jgi:TIR domain-containing protein
MKADAFISHASANADIAEALVNALEADKLKAWIDSSDMKFGALLRNQLQASISGCRVLVLLWSKPAFKSRWVLAEMFTAIYLDRFIIPCVLDSTPLPQFLANAAYLDRKRDGDRLGERLCGAVRGAPDHANDVSALILGDTSVVQPLINAVAAGQYAALAAIGEDFDKAVEANRHVGSALRNLQELAPLHPMVLNLAGYQCKNDYMMKHWDAIQVWRAPKDELLDRGERHFFESLCVNPFDESAINGLGNILFFERELDAAEFFHSRAADLYLKRTGEHYEAAEHDLEMVRRFRKRQAQPARA